MIRLVIVLIVLAISISAPAAEPTTAATQPSAIEQALDRKMPEVRIKKVTLRDAVEFLRDVSGANIIVDHVALKAAGLNDKTPISLDAKNAPLRQVLGMLAQKISKPAHTFVAGAVGNVAMITTKPRLDAANKRYQADLAKIADGDPAHLARALPDVRFDKTKFADVIDFVRDVGGANIWIDWKALEALGVTPKTPVDLRLRNLPLHEVLRAVLTAAGDEEVKLDFTVDANNVITITGKRVKRLD